MADAQETEPKIDISDNWPGFIPIDLPPLRERIGEEAYQQQLRIERAEIADRRHAMSSMVRRALGLDGEE